MINRFNKAPLRKRLVGSFRVLAKHSIAAAMAIGILLWGALPLHASQPVSLEWDVNSEPDIVGYRLHYGTSSGQYTTSVDVGNLTRATIQNLADENAYFFTVTAYNMAGLESQTSNEAVRPAIPPDPTIGAPTFVINTMQRMTDGTIKLIVTGAPGKINRLWASTDLQTWTPLQDLPNTTGSLEIIDDQAGSFKQRFYRLSAD